MYALRWETKELKELGAFVQDAIKKQVATTAGNFWVKSTVAGVSATAAAMLMFPIWITEYMAGLDNSWMNVANRAQLAGRALAEALLDSQAVGMRPVNLVGFSCGARVIFYCLIELAERQAFNVVNDVVLLGAPIDSTFYHQRFDQSLYWGQARSAVSGRFINGYSKHDWFLGFIFRYMEWGVRVAGLGPVKLPGIENVDLRCMIKSHNDYAKLIDPILTTLYGGERAMALLASKNEADAESDEPNGKTEQTDGGKPAR
jgi:hypothetical protein